MKPTLQTILPILRREKQYMEEQFGIVELGVFGSVARGEATEASDVDILVSFRRVPGFFLLFKVQDYLEKQLGITVDLVRRQDLPENTIQTTILQEVITI
jgi:uncharacterized protein